MFKVLLSILVFLPIIGSAQDEQGLSKETLIQIIFVLAGILIIILTWELSKSFKKKFPRGISHLFRKVSLEVTLEKDRLFRPQLLTLKITNTGKNEADINAPVLEFRKIWSNRKFKLSGISGRFTYPLYLEPGSTHQLRIETATFHQYDRAIKSYYWARIFVSDVYGRKWKSKPVKLRKSLVT